MVKHFFHNYIGSLTNLKNISLRISYIVTILLKIHIFVIVMQ